MALYRDHILPRIVDMTCGTKILDDNRRRTCAGLHGRVIEIGFGSGRNVEFYPDAVDSVSAIEPAGLGWKLARKRLAVSNIPVERAGLDGQALPFADNSFDTALSTWTLCTIPDVEAALGELRRVLVPGGTLHFVEHGLAPHERVRTWQHRFDPMQQWAFGGCHLNRDIAGLIAGAGFDIHDLDRFYAAGVPKSSGALSLGVASSPAGDDAEQQPR